MHSELIFISGFIIFITAMLSLDLGLFTKTDKPVSTKQAGIMSVVWVTLAMGFYLLILNFGDLLHHVNNFAYLQQINLKNFHQLKLDPNNFAGDLQLYRSNLALEFITGYVVEYALSVDNIFIIVLIFTAFAVDKKHYHKVLFWGIIGAVIMRFIFIFVGAALIGRFHWILFVFGAFLVYTGVMMFINRNNEEEIDPENHRVVRFASKYFPVYPKFVGDRFFVKIDHKKYITPLLLVLLIIELTDLVFAVDSIPAIFSITKDPYIVFFSNIFAILGLRSMFFLLVNIIDKFHYLKIGLSLLLTFIGLKMLAVKYVDRIGLTTVRSLLIIVTILAVSVAASLMFPKKQPGVKFIAASILSPDISTFTAVSEKTILKLQLPTDPLWVKNVVESNIEELLTDHAFCEQKAASNAITLIVQNPNLSDLVQEMALLVQEEMDHFKRVHDIILARGYTLGRERKDNYVNELRKFIIIGGGRTEQLIDRLLFSAMIEARSCERFKVLSENINDPELSSFYHELMISEATHYTMFIRLAKKYAGEIDVDKRWKQYLQYEASVIQSYGKRETIHG